MKFIFLVCLLVTYAACNEYAGDVDAADINAEVTSTSQSPLVAIPEVCQALNCQACLDITCQLCVAAGCLTPPSSSTTPTTPLPPSTSSSPPATTAATTICTDISPDSNTCADHKGWGACQQSWTKDWGYCSKTCEHCTSSTTPVAPPPAPVASPPQATTCNDISPDSNTCADHKVWGACQQSWTKDWGYCSKTCGHCTSSTTPVTSPPKAPPPPPPKKKKKKKKKKPSPPPPPPQITPPPTTPPPTDTDAIANYAKALELSYLFFDAQRSGDLPPSVTQRVPWRGDSHVTDPVPGGFYDAGDHLKLNFPLATSLSFLAWGLLEFPDSYSYAGQTKYAKDTLAWGADYLMASHIGPNKLVGQVGDPGIDHAYWGSAEAQTGPRPSYVWDATKPASDLAAATSAALTATSLVFKDSDPAYAAKLLQHGKELFTFASTYLGKYSDQYASATYVYRSFGYLDDLAWAASWLCKATGENSYCNKAIQYRADSSFGPNSFVNWDSVGIPSALLLKSMGKAPQEALDHIDRFYADWQKNFPKTPGGLAIAPLGGWGNNRHSGNAALASLVAAKYETNATKKANAICFAKSQLDYFLGLSGGRSFVVGFGQNPPTQPHHRGSSCPNKPAPCGWDAFNAATPNPQILYGALVGGPKGPGDEYQDLRSLYVENEVAFDYNAGYTGALAGIIHFLKS